MLHRYIHKCTHYTYNLLYLLIINAQTDTYGSIRTHTSTHTQIVTNKGEYKSPPEQPFFLSLIISHIFSETLYVKFLTRSER